jgi:ligand-binding sensor domain-containing protein
VIATALLIARCLVPDGPAVARVEWRGAEVLAREGAVTVGGRAITPCDGLPDAHPTALAVVGDRLVVGTRLGAFVFDSAFRPIGPREPVRALAARGDTLFLGSARGLYQLDGDRATRVKHAVLGRHEITALRVAPDGALHAGAGTAGWWRIAARTTRVSAIYAGCFLEKSGRVVARAPGPHCTINDVPPASGLPSGHVTALAHHAGALFVGTFDHGLARSDGDRFRAVEGAPRMVNALLSDGDSLLVGSPRGLYRVRGDRVEPVALGLEDEHISGMVRAPDGTLWLATGRGLAALGPDGLRFVDARLTYAVALAADGAVWAGTAHGAIRFAADGTQEHLHEWVTSLLADGDGMLAGTYDRGVVRIGADGSETHIAGLSRAWVNPNGLIRVGDGLAVATLGDGLLIARLSSVDKLPIPIDDVTSLIADGATMWVGTRGGLISIEGRNKSRAP